MLRPFDYFNPVHVAGRQRFVVNKRPRRQPERGIGWIGHHASCIISVAAVYWQSTRLWIHGIS